MGIEVTVTEAGRTLGMSRDQVMGLVCKGTLVHRNTQAGVMVDADSIRAFMEAERDRCRAAMADLADLQNELGLID